MECNITRNYLTEKARMTRNCRMDCRLCKMQGAKHRYGNCADFEAKQPEKAIRIVQDWSDAHPGKTILEDFLGKYPDAETNDGIPAICAKFLGYGECPRNIPGGCVACWDRILSEVQDAQQDN